MTVSPYIARQAQKLKIGAKHDLRPSDYSTPRVRSDREWVDLERTPKMESVAEQIVGVLLLGACGAAAIVIIANLVRIFA